MSAEQRIEDLIKIGWGVVDSDFDPMAFHHWRRSAFDCLNAMFGPDHVYTRHFENFVRQGGKKGLLAAGGILIAAKEQAVLQLAGTVKANGAVMSVPLTEKRRPHKSEGHINNTASLLKSSPKGEGFSPIPRRGQLL